jgi:hypothetical protein
MAHHKLNKKGGLTIKMTADELNGVRKSFKLTKRQFKIFLNYMDGQNMSPECSFYGQVEGWLEHNEIDAGTRSRG